ncbi:MAG: neuraminidase-like domain-containing protein, partial [Cyanobacteria bacterium P01_F01_bin.4]
MYLKQQARHNQVIQAVAAVFGIDLAISTPLLTQWVTHPSDGVVVAMALFLSDALVGIGTDTPLEITVANFPEQIALFRHLEKIAIVLKTLEIPTEATELLLTQLPTVGWLDLTALPLDPAAADPSQFDAWARMVKIVLSAQSFPGGLPSFFDLLSVLHQLAPSRPDFLALLAERSGWRLADLDVLCGETGFDYPFPADFLDGGWLVQLAPCFTLLQRLGVAAADALEWAVLNSGEDAIAAAQATARKIKQTVRGKYDEAQWSALAKLLRDRLREQQRAAAVTYLVHHITQPQRLRNASDLYDKYLIDVEMDPCMITSRIKQAISSVQLFVQRCFMNLEPDVVFTPDDAKEWAWMKNYRVWEANRKVFLYPENWIQPELRDDKTELFRELESGLLQDETTEAVVERELLKYLKSLNRIAQLNICGLYLEGEIHRQVLHVVARTQNTPHIYYYRTWVNQRHWTAWQHIDVDIEGDHLVPIVWNRRLYLFWPMFVEKAVEEIVDEGDAKKPKRFYEIKLFWTEYKDNQWQPKQLTNEFLTTPAKRTSIDPKQFSFWAALTKAGGLAVYCNQLLNQFHFVNCEGTLKPERVAPTKLIQNPPGTARHFNAFQEISEKKLKLVTSGKLEDLGVPGYLYQLPNDQKVAEVLRKTPGTFSI